MKIFCFDFDGTIADTLPIIVKKANHLLKKSGEEEISDELLRKLREKGIEKVFLEMKVPLYKLFFLYLKVKKEISHDISKLTVKEEVRETIRKIKERGDMIGILTSNSKENVESFLEKNNLNFFDFINTSGILGKEREIKKLKRKGGIFVYIGDEVRDIRAGRKAKVKTVAVLWGLSSRKALLRERPDFLIERPQELLEISL
jgi:phosphoglycolate phosphatase